MTRVRGHVKMAADVFQMIAGVALWGLASPNE